MSSPLESPTTVSPPSGKNTLTVTDNRTGKTYEIAITNETCKALDFRPIKENPSDFGTMIYDPGYYNTAVCKSQITYIDGDQGILEYRGYSIEDLAANSSFVEVAYLLIFGSLPSSNQLNLWNSKIMNHTFIHENLIQLMKSFRYDAHPMGMLISSMSAMSTFYPEANPALKGADIYKNKALMNKQIFRILGKLPTIAACAYRHRIGRPYNNPTNTLSYTENFLYMLDRLSETNYKPHPVLTRALDKLFIIHADHELNCSTATMRQIASTLVDPYSAVAGAASALYGPLHGGANEAVLRMLEQIGSVENIPSFLEAVKQKKQRLMGFGHRVYKSYDPRAKILKEVTQEVFALLGKNPLMEIATELERHALTDRYFIDRQLYPNVDFYSGIIYKTMGFPTDMFPVLFSIPRAAGWLAHWVEELSDADLRIFRPRQIYLGKRGEKYIPLENRVSPQNELSSYASGMSSRRQVSDNDETNAIPKTANGSKSMLSQSIESTFGN
ncbi:citrate synthase [Heterostelium album PN500]|uniref:Citrate synthase n=1 Tax=Heterostelium pallidum (strain ATCC 26659 / Pp 5 / PN500) TaxID=670386 RepID=D3BI35_HETP5|nr:citrate synthase [Heterostelium album PN500]EFA78935.1 citrate synthase [Heterostelium album PN500]|eukprot:XP_020431059.1 citrate synthase [Heterostelium album PN500]